MSTTGTPVDASTHDRAARPDAGAASTVRYALKKLPEVTLIFWIMKIAGTTLGETGGDEFAQTLKLGYFLATIALFAVFVVSLVVQLRARRYNPFAYWTVIVTTSMAGTTISDFMNRDASAKYLKAGTTSLGWGPQGLGIGYPAGMSILLGLLALVFVLWKTTGLTFDINKINTFRGEAIFWSAILISNTLGTSLGDYLSDSSGLGYTGAALVISAALAVLFGLRYVRAVSNVVLFWLAFVLTRPWGASVGDYLTKPAAKGGLALGTLGASLVLLAVLLGFMGVMALRERSRPESERVAYQAA